MIQAKEKDNVSIAFRNEKMGDSAQKEAFQKTEQTMVMKFQEPRVLIECNLIVEVSQSVAERGKHADYIERLTRGMLERNKHIKAVFDIDAFEP